jgi:hypothetical protein
LGGWTNAPPSTSLTLWAARKVLSQLAAGWLCLRTRREARKGLYFTQAGAGISRMPSSYPSFLFLIIAPRAVLLLYLLIYVILNL